MNKTEKDLYIVSINVDLAESNGYEFPPCFLRISTCFASNRDDAIAQFRVKSGCSLPDMFLTTLIS
jgi:hypothetical protein